VIIFDVAQSRTRLEKLRKETSVQGFWDDQETARKKMAHMSRLESEVSLYDRIMSHISELEEMNGLGLEEEDTSFEAEISSWPRCCRASSSTTTPSSRCTPAPAAWSRRTGRRC
jgi:hypothetical protein